MSPAEAARLYGVTIRQMYESCGRSRRYIERLWYSNRQQFEVIAIGVGGAKNVTR